LVVYFFQKKAMPGLGSSEHLKVVARHTLGGNGGLVLVEIGDKDPKRRLLLSTGAGATQLILDMGYVGMPEEDVSAAVVENVLPAASGVTQAVEARTNQSFEALMQESIRQPVVTVQDVASVRQSSSLDEALLDLPGVEENKVMKPAVQSREIFHTAEPAQKNVDRSALQALNVPSVLTAPSPGEGTAATRNKQGVNRKSAAARFLSAAQMAPPARQYIANSPSAAPATPVVQREQRKPAPPVPSKPVNPAFTAALDLIDDELRRRDEELVGGV
jgi:hypothetical protein